MHCYVVCTETAVSNPPVVFPKSSCDVHLFRGPCIIIQGIHPKSNKTKLLYEV